METIEFRLHNADEMELLPKVKLTLSDYPIAYAAKLKELVDSGMPEDEAKTWLDNAAFELELYYHPDHGMFAVESEAVESGTIYSPYSGELMDDYTE